MMQDIILAAFLREQQFFSEYSHLLDEDYFEDSSHKIPVSVYIDYVEQYRQMPSDQEMYAELDKYCRKYGIDPNIKQQAIETIQRCYKISFNVDYARDNFLKFATRNKLTKAIIDSAKDIRTKGDQLDDSDYERIQKRITEAIEIRSRDTKGILLADVADDPKTFIHNMNRYDPAMVVKTGLPSLDSGHIAGGMLRGELGVVSAPPGAGKSTFLVNVGAHAVVSGKDVVHIFVGDNSEADGVLRYCARLTGATMAQVMLNAQVYLDAWNKLKTNFNLGNLIIGAYPIDGPTVSDIRSFVTRNMVRKGINPAVVIVDYADNCKRDPRLNSYEALGTIYREMKNMCEELNVVGWTASQPKVETWDSEKIGLSALAESSMKQQIIDALLTMSKHDDQRFSIYVAKFRRGRADYSIEVQLNYERMSIKESAVSRIAAPQSQSQAVVTPPVSPQAPANPGMPTVPQVPSLGGFGSTKQPPAPPSQPSGSSGNPPWNP